MVYERYIKKGGQVYGPYLYESYRDKHGVKRTRYVSGPEDVASGKKFSFSFSFFVGIVIALLIVGFLFANYYVPEKIQSYKFYLVSNAKVVYYSVLPVVQRASSSINGYVVKEQVGNGTILENDFE